MAAGFRPSTTELIESKATAYLLPVEGAMKGKHIACTSSLLHLDQRHQFAFRRSQLGK